MTTRAWMLGALLLLSAPALARGRSQSPFAFRAAVDGPVLAGALALWITPVFLQGSLAGPACNPCDHTALNALDRPVVHFNSEGADRASNILAVGLPVLALGAKLVDLDRGGWPLLEDLFLMLESAAVTGAIQQTVAFAVRRPRPFMYRDASGAENRREADAGLSFFSGHTSMAFAVASSFAHTYGVRRPRSGLRPLVWVVALLAASSMPVLRVASGEHFWTDVIVGAIVGTGVGIAVPELHRRRGREPSLRARIGPGPGGSGLGLWASF